jgi:hypothetical protein
VDRWLLAAESAAKHGLAILDGDPFQALWYGRAYRFAEFQSLSTMTSFYREAITAGRLAFPDRYILLAVDEPVLHERKRGDASRSRRNFAKHASLLRYQPRYFAAMNDVGAGPRARPRRQRASGHVGRNRDLAHWPSAQHNRFTGAVSAARGLAEDDRSQTGKFIDILLPENQATPSREGPRVRIPLAPAASQLRT